MPPATKKKRRRRPDARDRRIDMLTDVRTNATLAKEKEAADAQRKAIDAQFADGKTSRQQSGDRRVRSGRISPGLNQQIQKSEGELSGMMKETGPITDRVRERLSGNVQEQIMQQQKAAGLPWDKVESPRDRQGRIDQQALQQREENVVADTRDPNRVMVPQEEPSEEVQAQRTRQHEARDRRKELDAEQSAARIGKKTDARDRRNQMVETRREARRIGLEPSDPRYAAYIEQKTGGAEQAIKLAEAEAGSTKDVARIQAETAGKAIDSQEKTTLATLDNLFNMKGIDAEIAQGGYDKDVQLMQIQGEIAQAGFNTDVWKTKYEGYISQQQNPRLAAMTTLGPAVAAGTMTAEEFWVTVNSFGGEGAPIVAPPSDPKPVEQRVTGVQGVGKIPDNFVETYNQNLQDSQSGAVDITGQRINPTTGAPAPTQEQADATATAAEAQELAARTIPIPGDVDGIVLSREQTDEYNDHNSLAVGETGWIKAFGDIAVGDFGSSDIEDQQYAGHIDNMANLLTYIRDLPPEHGRRLARAYALNSDISKFENAEWGGIWGTMGAKLENAQKGFLITLQNYSRGRFNEHHWWNDILKDKYISTYLSDKNAR